MPIYMDRHFVPNITAKAAAEAHREDVKIQEDYGCRAITYWVDEKRDSAFCLIDAPDIDTVKEMHAKAHGLIPHEIIQVNSNVVEAFLGRIQDPEIIGEANADFKVFNDPAFRVILVTKAMDPLLLEHQIGKVKTTELLTLRNDIIREHIITHEGREVDLDGQGFVISFVSVNQAVLCAMAILRSMHIAAELIDLRIGIHAGVPVDSHKFIFGTTISFARSLCSISQGGRIIASSLIHELYKKNITVDINDIVKWIKPSDEGFLRDIFEVLDASWRNPEFGVDQLGRLLSLSTSNLYRKCKATTDKSPNTLIGEHRLIKALELMKSGQRNIAQTTFDSGFTSPSYFAKCFQKQFGIQPNTYLKQIG